MVVTIIVSGVMRVVVTLPASQNGPVTRCTHIVVQLHLKDACASGRCNQVQVQSQVHLLYLPSEIPGAPDSPDASAATNAPHASHAPDAELKQLMDANFSQERVVGRGCSDKGGPGQLLEGECEAFQSGERTEKYRN